MHLVIIALSLFQHEHIQRVFNIPNKKIAVNQKLNKAKCSQCKAEAEENKLFDDGSVLCMPCFKNSFNYNKPNL